MFCLNNVQKTRSHLLLASDNLWFLAGGGGLSLLVFYVTCKDISVICVKAQMCRRTEEFGLRSGSKRHRHFAGFFNLLVLHRHGTNLLYGDSDTPSLKSPFTTRWGYGGRMLDLTPPPRRPQGDAREGRLLSIRCCGLAD